MNRTVVKSDKKNKYRVLILFGVFLILIVALFFRLGYHQIVKADDYQALATAQQKDDISVDADRGSILDTNGNELATTTVSYTIWASEEFMTDTEAREKLYDENVENLGEIIGMEADEIKDIIENTSYTVAISTNQSKEVADLVTYSGIPGVSVSEEVDRYYTYGNFASQILGSVTDDGSGLSGIELHYNSELSGVDGRWVLSTDNNGVELVSGTEIYYPATDGSDIVLTIDQSIQYYVEEVVNEAYEAHDSDQVSAIVMSVKTGEILAAATAPSFDPNNAREPADEDELKEFSNMTSEEQMDYLNNMWRSPLFNDSYEPGSTFKLFTVAMALEEDVTSLDETFTCTGSIDVADATISCTAVHGTQTLTEAVSNSCNPVQVELATRIGIEKFYNYLDLFGITEITGVDFPGEGSSIMQSEDDAGPVGIATIGFGQGITITPIQLITGVASIGNDGELMQPHLVKEIISADGEVAEIEPNIIRKTISTETADIVKEIMLGVVEDGTGSAAQIAGYEIGGKTATAEVVEDGEYTNNYITSFISMVPMDDPEIIILFINNNAKKGGTYSSSTAVGWSKMIMENVIDYLDIPPSDESAHSEDEEEDLVKVPEVTGLTETKAIKTLEDAGFNYKVSPAEIEGTKFKVAGQYPESGTKAEEGSVVYIYQE